MEKSQDEHLKEVFDEQAEVCRNLGDAALSSIDRVLEDWKMMREGIENEQLTLFDE